VCEFVRDAGVVYVTAWAEYLDRVGELCGVHASHCSRGADVALNEVLQLFEQGAQRAIERTRQGAPLI
jgi:hypothetical protein